MAEPDVKVDGVVYTAEAVAGARNEVIALRNAALKQNQFDWAVLLSHVVVYLAEYALLLRTEEMEGGERERSEHEDRTDGH